MSFTSDEVNYLIYRYLEESGLRHSAFMLANESMLARSAINGADVAPGALVALLQKGLQDIDVEWHLTDVRAVVWKAERGHAHALPLTVAPASNRPALLHAASHRTVWKSSATPRQRFYRH